MNGRSHECDTAPMDTFTHMTGMQLRAYMDDALAELAAPPSHALNGDCALRTVVTAVFSASMVGVAASSLHAELAQPISSPTVPVWLSPRSQALGHCLIDTVLAANEFANDPHEARRRAVRGWVDARVVDACDSAWSGLRAGGVSGVAQRAIVERAWRATTPSSDEVVEIVSHETMMKDSEGAHEECEDEVVGWEVDGANVAIVTAMLLDVRGLGDRVIE